MLLQVEVPAKALAADLAAERFLVVVGVHVKGQVVDLVEGLVADVALVGLFAAVRQPVVLVVALLVETLAAVLAREGLVVCVDSYVGVQGRATVEGLAAVVTLVRLLLGVDYLVTTQSARLAKALVADLADEGPGSGVHGHVTSEVIVGVEDLAALRAYVGLLLSRVLFLRGRVLLLPARGLFGFRLVYRRRRRHFRVYHRWRWWRLVGRWRCRKRPQQRTRVIVEQRVVLEKVLVVPEGRDVLLEGRLQVGRVTQRQTWRSLLQKRRCSGRRRRRRGRAR